MCVFFVFLMTILVICFFEHFRRILAKNTVNQSNFSCIFGFHNNSADLDISTNCYQTSGVFNKFRLGILHSTFASNIATFSPIFKILSRQTKAVVPC